MLSKIIEPNDIRAKNLPLASQAKKSRFANHACPFKCGRGNLSTIQKATAPKVNMLTPPPLGNDKRIRRAATVKAICDAFGGKVPEFSEMCKRIKELPR